MAWFPEPRVDCWMIRLSLTEHRGQWGNQMLMGQVRGRFLRTGHEELALRALRCAMYVYSCLRRLSLAEA